MCNFALEKVQRVKFVLQDFIICLVMTSNSYNACPQRVSEMNFLSGATGNGLIILRYYQFRITIKTAV